MPEIEAETQSTRGKAHISHLRLSSVLLHTLRVSKAFKKWERSGVQDFQA